MVSLWSPIFFCFLLSSLLPWVHCAKEEKNISISNADLPKVPRLFILFFVLNFFDQEVEVNQTEQLNSDLTSLKEEIKANWSQPGMQKVLLSNIYSCNQNLYPLTVIRCGKVW